MKDFWTGLLMFLALVIVALGISWLFQGNDFFVYRAFAPKYEGVRRQTFEQSYAYNAGVAQNLHHEQMEYIKAKPDEKAAIASVILHETSSYDTTNLPPDLQQFIGTLREKYNGGLN